MSEGRKSFVERLGQGSSLDDGDPIEIHLICHEYENEEAGYSYLAIHASQVRELNLSLLRQAKPDIEKHGVILAEGNGEPSDEVVQYIESMLVAK